MLAKRRTRYAKVGAFILLGIVILIALGLVFGMDRFFQKTIYFETYFNESVSGISLGSQVKYRGVQIGTVDAIDFIQEIYRAETISPENSKLIYVRLAITAKMFTKIRSSTLRQRLEEAIKTGLRIKLVSQGITGTSYLELDYVTDGDQKVPIITWIPNDNYIPAAESAMTKFSRGAEYVFDELKQIDFKQVFNKLEAASEALTAAVVDLDELLTNELVENLRDLGVLTNDLKQIAARLKVQPTALLLGRRIAPVDPRKL